MKQERHRTRAALMLSAAALLSIPILSTGVLAQAAAPAEQAVPVTPPPVTATAPPATTGSGESATPVNPEAAAQAAAEDAERLTGARAVRRTNSITRRAVRRTNAPPVAPAPAEPAASEPLPAPPPPAEVGSLPAQTAPVPAPSAADPNAVTEVENTTAAAEQPQEQAAEPATAAEAGPPMWPLALIALLIVVGGVWFLLSRRRKAAAENEWATPPLAAEPVVHRDPAIERPIVQETARPAPIAPVAAASIAADVTDVAPVVAEDASVETAHRDDVAALTAANTVGDRPWLEFAMRPIRAGTSADEALVEIELTVANAGNMVAEDVRISTFMLPAGNDGDLDRMLVKGDDSVTPQTIAAGEGTRVDATLAMTRASLPEGGTFQPVVVADARYRLPDGSEGRTSAAFLIGGLADDGATIQPMDLEARLIREDVSAQLYRDPVRI